LGCVRNLSHARVRVGNLDASLYSMFHRVFQYTYKLEVMQRKGSWVLCVRFVYLNP